MSWRRIDLGREDSAGALVAVANRVSIGCGVSVGSLGSSGNALDHWARGVG